MKTNMKKVMIMAMTVVAFAMTLTSCKNDENTVVAKESIIRDAKVTSHHDHPIEGTYGDALVTLKCINTAFIEIDDETKTATYQVHSVYRINGGNVQANVEGIDGCHKVLADGRIEGTNLTVIHLYDSIVGGVIVRNVMTTAGPQDIDFTSKIQRPLCHLSLDTVCFNSNDRILEGKGHDELMQRAHAQGEWYGLITIHDTNWQVVYVHDTVIRTEYIHDTVHVIVTDTIIESGDTTTWAKYYINKHIADLGVVNNKVGGRDSLVVVTFKNGNFYSRNGWVYEHWTLRTLSGFNTPFASEDDGACTEIVNGNGNFNGHHAVGVSCGNTTITGLPSDVIMFADPCEPHGYRSCINGTTAVVRYAWDNGVECATENVTITYNGSNPPEPPTPGDTIHVPGTVLFAGHTLSMQDPVGGSVVPEYYTVIEYAMSDGSVHRMFREETSTAAFTNVALYSGVTATTVTNYVANGYYPSYCYNYTNGANTHGVVNNTQSGSAWVIRWISYNPAENVEGMFTNANSTSNIFYGNAHPAVVKAGYLTGNGSLNINGTPVFIQGN